MRDEASRDSNTPAYRRRAADLSRRHFLGTAVAAGAVVTRSVRVVAAEPAPSPCETIGIAAIGVGRRSRLLLEQLPTAARIVALCDCNLDRAHAFRDEKRATWPVYQDYRRLLERSDIDAVIVGTADFQRVLPCLDACRAGKDIYAEKPLSLTVREGRLLVDAVRASGRVLQVGTQQRSITINKAACDLIRSGGLGNVLEVRVRNYTGPREWPAGEFPEERVPEGLDWNMWLSQAAVRPFNAALLDKWGAYRDFSGGEMTNWGAHGVDQIQWALGTDDTGPTEIVPLTGGRDGQVSMRYANGVPVNFVLEKNRGPAGGAVFVCERGKLEINRNKVVSNPPEIARELLATIDVEAEERRWSDAAALWQARWHLEDWLNAIKTRGRPVADVEVGHRSVTVCHLANIARRIGRPLRWNPVEERFLDDKEADSLLDPPRRNGFELPPAT